MKKFEMKKSYISFYHRDKTFNNTPIPPMFYVYHRIPHVQVVVEHN
jgi:hypothetical protein